MCPFLLLRQKKKVFGDIFLVLKFREKTAQILIAENERTQKRRKN